MMDLIAFRGVGPVARASHRYCLEFPMRRIRFQSALIGIALTLAGTGTTGASEACAGLKAQLVSVSSQSGSSDKYRRYAAAVTKQMQQIRKVRADLSRFGCTTGSFIVLGGKNPKACAKLKAGQTKMQANLAALERKRDSYSERDNRLAKRRIEAAMKANDCDGRRALLQAAALKGQQDAERSSLQSSDTIVAALGGADTSRIMPVPTPLSTDQGPQGSRIIIEPPAARGGNYRTLCVRSCDGFFFPVSSAASPSDFARDERTCQMMCPGTKTALYFHSAFGQESQDMVSARTRAPYTDMPNAFAYRNTDAPMSKACSCNMRAFHQEMIRREAILNGTANPDAPVSTWVRPLSRPDPGEDPETMLDAELRLTTEDVAAVVAASQIERPLTQERQEVRMVGPSFLPEQDGGLDLKSGGQQLFR
jgi:hypothetical protein